MAAPKACVKLMPSASSAAEPEASAGRDAMPGGGIVLRAFMAAALFSGNVHHHRLIDGSGLTEHVFQYGDIMAVYRAGVLETKVGKETFLEEEGFNRFLARCTES
jgi:hypothetical protein